MSQLNDILRDKVLQSCNNDKESGLYKLYHIFIGPFSDITPTSIDVIINNYNKLICYSKKNHSELNIVTPVDETKLQILIHETKEVYNTMFLIPSQPPISSGNTTPTTLSSTQSISSDNTIPPLPTISTLPITPTLPTISTLPQESKEITTKERMEKKNKSMKENREFLDLYIKLSANMRYKIIII